MTSNVPTITIARWLNTFAYLNIFDYKSNLLLPTNMAIPQDSATANRPPKTKGTQLAPEENSDIARIRNCLQGGADAAEVASEGYRVCRINAFLRRDLQQARNEIRKNRVDRQTQSVQEDALKELRDELPATRQMLERLWGLLEQRKVKIPDDVKADYQALKTKDSHDWQPRQRVRTVKSVVAKGKRIEKPKTKTERKAERQRVDKLHKRLEEGKAKQTKFLLHTPDGEMYDARKPVLIPDEAGDEDVAGEQMTAEEAAAIEHADFMKNGSSYRPRALTPPSGLVAKNVVAGVKRRSSDSNPFATLKMGEIEGVFVSIAESQLG
ncbi:uncharacterized protein J4E88_006834 [Alternaria novae-zelandiae]|uniref:uncharacterized protein n=1 Tax=Alternaria novae-zelandiae TaxID=430562 RepID=UPI0020C389D1|nr:uncharacterized protein J4E88_006834 [Alternaria novae-zelandiae]KAI4678313.1 hypothetical protein J4E88_006834 [Alternaria novae-zelandiae]